MKEHGTLFRGFLVREILAGRKWNTRRLPGPTNSLVDGSRQPRLFAQLDFSKAWVDKGPSPAGNQGPYLHVPHKTQDTVHRVYPQWQRGDVLWVRETWLQWACPQHDEGQPPGTRCDCRDRQSIRYFADHPPGTDRELHAVRWKPGIHLPRWASRITLDISEVRVQRVQEISNADIWAEGFVCPYHGNARSLCLSAVDLPSACQSLREGFAKGWDAINGKRPGGAWAANGFVWAISWSPLKAAV